MSKILSIIFAFFLTNTPVYLDNFNKAVNDGYNSYILIDENTIASGHLLVAFGKVSNSYKLSVCFLNNSSTDKIYINIYVDDTLTTFVPDSNLVEGYNVTIKENQEIKIYQSHEGGLETKVLLKSYQSSELIQKLINNPITGNGKNNFPRNKKEVELIDTIKRWIIGLIVFAIILVVLLIIILRFKQNQEPLKKNDIIDATVIDVNIEEQEENISKEEIMDRYFKEFRSGDISEDELNEKLKKLWWKNDQD